MVQTSMRREAHTRRLEGQQRVKKSPEKLLRPSYLQHRTAFSTTARLVKNDGGHLVGQLPPPMNGLESATLLMDECAVVKQPPHNMASGGKAVSALWRGEKKT
jgi:hypothetical protein